MGGKFKLIIILQIFCETCMPLVVTAFSLFLRVTWDDIKSISMKSSWRLNFNPMTLGLKGMDTVKLKKKVENRDILANENQSNNQITPQNLTY